MAIPLPPKPMPKATLSPLLTDLIEAANQSPEALATALDMRKMELSPSIANEARQLSRRAIQAGRFVDAIVLAGISATAYLELGNIVEHLRGRLEIHQADYLQSESEEDYLRVSQDFDALALDCMRQGAKSIELQAVSLGSNCLLFASRATADPSRRVAILLPTLDRLHQIMTRGGAALSTNAGFGVFVAALVEGISEANGGIWVDGAATKRDALLKQLARDVESVVPLGYGSPDDPERTVATARALADLSVHYGTPSAGEARLAAAAARFK